ncbi:fibrinogen-like YCDxxxxGGGW domain-containing protein [Microbacterium sp. p3-SID336]|uniref:fibrinogen-like YCDxxxxGGGW domain-containing protein n=1 Tax=Microbacterium sp. p3-SID336 TaxID=2916212 RepID=UPI0021A35CB7|nr:fibrinogen-like YCDxxxxGGGW domain-containing protein [Microbacterium sp. p3-SID336]MCT1478148.1 fibronectin type III domain-containing protein [Microbacterium sp. p3-SID336]
MRSPGRRARAIAGAAVAALAVMGSLLVPNLSASAATGPDGKTQETAAASCWEIKQNNPAATNGVYWLVTPGLVYPQQFYCDQTTDGGGWVLVGRGREGWKEGYNGLGTPEAVANTPTGPAAFAPAELPAKTVDALIYGRRVDALTDGIRVQRATNAEGSNYLNLRIHLKDRDRWVWTFGAQHLVNSWEFGFPVFSSGTGGTTSNLTGQTGLYNVVFSQRATHGYRMGWAYGSAVTGTTDASSYLWAPTGQGYATPFTQVYLRPRLLLSDMDFGTVPTTGTPASTLPAIPNTYASKTAWGVSGLANGLTNENNVEVADFGEVAGKVFVGGNFQFVQQTKDGVGQVEQPFLAAFDVKTGEWISTFRPKLDAQVKSIQALPDGRLAIGGQFSTVNGTAQPGLAILDPATGQLSGWQVKAEHRATGATPYIKDLDVQNGYLYVAGAMTHLTSVSATPTTGSAWNGGRIVLATGKPDTNWNANLNGTAAAVDANAQGDRAYFSGYFKMKSTTSTPSAAAIQTTAGAPLVSPLWVPKFSKATINADGTYSGNIWQLGVVEVGGRVWLGGSEHSMVSYDRNTFERLSGSITRSGGDLQTVETNGSVVIGGCHCGDYVYHDSYSFSTVQDGWTEADKINLMGAWDVKTGKYIPDWSPAVEARAGYGAWGTFFDSTGTLWVGGDFNRSQLSTGSEQWSGGFVRFAPRDAVAPSTPGAITSTPNADGVTTTLSWGASTDAAKVTYEVLRGNRVIATTTSTSYVVPVSSTATDYFVRARDVVGNRSASTAAFTVAPASSTALTMVANGDTWSWRYSSDVLPTNWNATGFDASSWATGKGLFARGVSGAGTNIDPTNLATKPLSAQFRKSFTVDDPTTVVDGKVSVVANDGAVVYLNGVELGRVRMPTGTIGQNTLATTAVSNATAVGSRAVFTVPAGVLVQGTNVLAASIHANYRTTTDLSFDLAFTAERGTAPAPAPNAVTGLTATPSATSVALRWTAPSSGTAPATYVITRNGVKVGTVTAPTTSFTDTGLTASTAYTYTVSAVAAAGTSSTPVSVSTTTTAVAPVGPPVSVPAGSSWSWRYSADVLPTTWNTTGFDASSWATGAAVLGRGTTVATNIDPTNLATKPLSAQFRKTFTVTSASTVKDGTVSVIADDGVVLYLNGVELDRANLPTGTITQNTYATAAPRSTTAAGAKVTFQVPAKLLVEGTNVLAASVHANYRTTPDLSFDLVLTMPR